ncbi:MAG: alpha-glucosidase/alpha-galactosidase [Lentisphaerae bacterium GWF2_52_8]|nr:MAG: alpha-glucosidase/alpha-galactosidase [Lentisphaerae bacterium GWF2_52_8]
METLGIVDKLTRPIKVVFLGAGSAFFEALFKDVMCIPGADKGEMAIVDIDKDRLKLAKALGQKILDLMGKDKWKLTATDERRKALKDADYIINCIEVSGVACVRFDNDIPKKYGIDQCIGDTIGPGGLFKALRTVPVFLEVLKDVEEICPAALVLNYTNPMSIMCLAAARTSPVNVIGLCHSVQGSSHQLASYTGVPYHELTWRCGGINHLAWFTELSHSGKDLYPELKRKARTDKKLLEKDPVRLDLMQYFDHFVTESSGHFSEYLPYYRKRQDLIDKHCREGYLGGSSFYADNWPTWRKNNDQNRRDKIAGKLPIAMDRTWEYASHIIQAIETNNPFIAHLTVPNTGLIENLPQDGVVEVGCVLDRRGVTPTYFGPLPQQCAALCDWHMRMYDLAADACIFKCRDLAAKALMLDPLSAAVCSPEEIKKMTEELFKAEKKFLPGF